MEGLKKTKSYIVATTKPWNINAFNSYSKSLPGKWTLIKSPDELTLSHLANINPEYIFFPHWSWRVADEIFTKYNCVCFHMADVPYGRGGSPLQNLIQRGHTETQLTALKMVEKLDAGAIYCKRPLSLIGSAKAIYEDMAKLAYEEIEYIIHNNPEPKPQIGKAVWFERRTPDQSSIPENHSPSMVYDHIRMLDADTYPRAFLNWDKLRFTFENASINSTKNEVTATVRITLKPEKDT